MKDKLDKEKVIEFTSYCIKNYDGINGLDSVFESFFAEKPVFTTADEIEMFMGDTYYTMGTPNDYWNIQEFKVNESCIILCPIGKIQFAKRENAEKYIRGNEKKYSLNEMVRIANHWAYIKSVNTEVALKVIESWK